MRSRDGGGVQHHGGILCEYPLQLEPRLRWYVLVMLWRALGPVLISGAGRFYKYLATLLCARVYENITP